MRLQKIISRLQKLHPKKIDLSLDRIKNLCCKLNNPQDKIKVISVVGTNGKFSTIQAMYSILKEAKYKCNIYTSPHIKKINERFIFNNKEIKDNELADLLEKVEKINNNRPITFFEILTSAYFYKAALYPNNINLVETGLFHRFDATNILKKNLANIVTPIGLDHLDWLPKNDQNIKRIIFEKTSSLLNSKIIIAKQTSKKIDKEIKKNIIKNSSKKLFYNENYNLLFNKNDFIYKENKSYKIKLSYPKILGKFQLENIASAIATLRTIQQLKLKDINIKKGISKINSFARLQEIKKGKIKNLVKKNKLFIDGSHNPLGAKVINQYLKDLKCNKHIILGMMANKDHNKFMNYFKNITTLTTIDVPNQPMAISGRDLKTKLKKFKNVKYKRNIFDALKSISLKKNDIILITGSLYLAGEILNLN
tara:strand:+ start:1256 stop:2524 length:1269 start_codon:yes stop_codon:yes gene_type:complete